MATQGSKKLYGRAELKKYFRNGEVPSETHYGYLIDSVIVQYDDGISKDEENGYIISPGSSSRKLITFYKNMDRLEPFFYVEKDNQESPSLKLQSGTAGTSQRQMDEASFFFHQGGNLGLGKRSGDEFKLDVNGFVGMEGRAGTYKKGSVPADGKWHAIVEGLDNCQAFELMARTGKKGTGKFAIMHAIALSAFGRSRSRIKKTQSYYGFFWNKLNLRWRGETHNFSLELKSNRNYGKDVQVFYNMSKLWDDELFVPQEYYYRKKNE